MNDNNLLLHETGGISFEPSDAPDPPKSNITFTVEEILLITKMIYAELRYEPWNGKKLLQILEKLK